MSTLSDRIAASVKNAPSKTARNRAKWLAVRDDVYQAMEDGWSAKKIWWFLTSEKKIECSYKTFLRFTKESRSAELPEENQTQKETTPSTDPVPGFRLQHYSADELYGKNRD